MRYSLFLLLALTSMAQCIQIEEGCEVKSEWRLKYEWPDMHLSAWVAPDTSDIITIEVEFDGHYMPITYDSIVLSSREIQAERVREGRPLSERNQTDFNVASGWMELVLTMNMEYSIKYNGKVITFGAVEFMPSFLTIRGSNVTVNCQSDKRVWKSDRMPSSVPLDESFEHSLDFYSSKEFLPALNLEMRDISFGWDNGTLTTIPSKAQPLPPFQEHKLTIICSQGDDLICSLLTGKERKSADDMRVGDLPRAVTFQGKTDATFYLILKKGRSLTLGDIVPQALEGMQSASGITVGLLVGIASIITIIVGVVVIVLVKRIRKRKQNQVQVPGRETPMRNMDIEGTIADKTERKNFLSKESSSEDSGLDENSSQSSISSSEA